MIFLFLLYFAIGLTAALVSAAILVERNESDDKHDTTMQLFVTTLFWPLMMIVAITVLVKHYTK